MTNAKHTPLHNALLIGDEDLGFVLSLHNSDGTNYANIKLFGSKKQCEANASFIVTAVNSHYEILETLKDIQSSLLKYDFLTSSNANQGRIRAIITKTAQAIAKTEKN